MTSEATRLAVLLTTPEFTENYIYEISTNDWQTYAAQVVWQSLLEYYKKQRKLPPPTVLRDIVEREEDDLKKEAALILLNDITTNPPTQQEREWFTDNVKSEIVQTRLKRRLEDIGPNDIVALGKAIQDVLSERLSIPSPIPLANLKQLDSTDYRCLLNNWAFERGEIMCINAPTGIGKSVLTFQLATHWAIGKSALGMTPHRSLKVLLLQNEDTEHVMARQRDGALQFMTEQEKQQVAEQLLVVRLRGYSGEAFVQALEVYCRKYDPDIIIVNPISKYFGEDEINAKAVASFFNAIEPILDRHQCGLVMISHTKKQSKNSVKEGMEDSYSQYGSSKWADFIRETVNLKKHAADGFYVLRTSQKREHQWGWREKILTKSSNPDLPYWQECTPEQILKLVKSTPNSTKDTVLNAIPNKKPGITREELITATGKSDKSIRLYLADLEKQGAIIKYVDDAPMAGRQAFRYYQQD